MKREKLNDNDKKRYDQLMIAFREELDNLPKSPQNTLDGGRNKLRCEITDKYEKKISEIFKKY